MSGRALVLLYLGAICALLTWLLVWLAPGPWVALPALAGVVASYAVAMLTGPAAARTGPHRAITRVHGFTVATGAVIHPARGPGQARAGLGGPAGLRWPAGPRPHWAPTDWYQVHRDLYIQTGNPAELDQMLRHVTMEESCASW